MFLLHYILTKLYANLSSMRILTISETLFLKLLLITYFGDFWCKKDWKNVWKVHLYFLVTYQVEWNTDVSFAVSSTIKWCKSFISHFKNCLSPMSSKTWRFLSTVYTVPATTKPWIWPTYQLLLHILTWLLHASYIFYHNVLLMLKCLTLRNISS